MKNKIKKSPYATLSTKTIRAKKSLAVNIKAKRLEGDDLRADRDDFRVNGGMSSGK